MFVPPNWIGLGAVALAGLVNPGFWVLGAGLELGYLFTLINNKRFQRVVDGQALADERGEWVRRQQEMVRRLTPEDRDRYLALQGRCQAILGQQRVVGAPEELKAQAEGLGRLMWIYLRLLQTRRALGRVVEEADMEELGDSLHDRTEDLEHRLKQSDLGDDLRKSLQSQLEILQQRMAKQDEARKKMSFLEAEMTRIQEQVELIREQAALAADPESVSQRIDQIAATLGGTTQWIKEQQQLYGRVEDLLVEPPPVTIPEAAQQEHA